MNPVRSTILHGLLPCALALLLPACVGNGPRPVADASLSGDGLATTRVSESFHVELSPDLGIDSLATWATPEGDFWLIASAKFAGRLIVFDADSGEVLREIGEPGEFDYPNGVAVFGDVLFVVERGSHRVQLRSLPDFLPLGSIGEDVLHSPYGIWLRESAPDEIEAFVTDSPVPTAPSPEADIPRVQRFRVRLDDDPIRAWPLDAFGRPDGAEALHQVESIAGDVIFDRLVIAEEKPELRSRGAAIHDLSGTYTGQRLGADLYRGDQEGIALYECQSGNGYWITTDQNPLENRFHVFDRASLDYLGSFAGEHTRQTDGITLRPAASERFPHGALYASSDDRGIAAFDWADIASALNLWLDCPE